MGGKESLGDEKQDAGWMALGRVSPLCALQGRLEGVGLAQCRQLCKCGEHEFAARAWSQWLQEAHEERGGKSAFSPPSVVIIPPPGEEEVIIFGTTHSVWQTGRTQRFAE